MKSESKLVFEVSKQVRGKDDAVDLCYTRDGVKWGIINLTKDEAKDLIVVLQEYYGFNYSLGV